MIFYIRYSDSYGEGGVSTTCRLKNADEIFSLQVVHRSGSYAWAEITLGKDAARDVLERRHDMITICVKEGDREECVFMGKILTNSVEEGDGVIRFKVLNKSGDQLRQLEQILERYREGHLYSKHLNQNGEYAQVIDNQPYDFYYDGRGNSVKLSRIIDEDNIVEMASSDYFSEVMKVRRIRPDISKMNVNINYNWTQIRSGEKDIFPDISARFPCGIINSYTNLEKYWRGFEKKLNNRIYKIEENCLYKLPFKESVSNFFGAQDGKKVAFRHFWFDGRLVISWRYEQKRRENIEFSIENSNRSEDSIEKDLEINLDLGKLATFIGSQDRDRIIESLASRAFSTIFAMERNTEVTIIGEYSKLKGITVDNTIKLRDKRFRDNFYIGKVVQVETRIESDLKVCKIQLLGNESGFSQFDYGKFMEDFKKRLAISIDEFREEKMKEIDSGDDIIENMEVVNPPEYQIETLKRNVHKNVGEIIRRLSKIPTFIKIKLRQFKDNKVIYSKISLGNFVL